MHLLFCTYTLPNNSLGKYCAIIFFFLLLNNNSQSVINEGSICHSIKLWHLSSGQNRKKLSTILTRLWLMDRISPIMIYNIPFNDNKELITNLLETFKGYTCKYALYDLPSNCVYIMGFIKFDPHYIIINSCKLHGDKVIITGINSK